MPLDASGALSSQDLSLIRPHLKNLRQDPKTISGISSCKGLIEGAHIKPVAVIMLSILETETYFNFVHFTGIILDLSHFNTSPGLVLSLAKVLGLTLAAEAEEDGPYPRSPVF